MILLISGKCHHILKSWKSLNAFLAGMERNMNYNFVTRVTKGQLSSQFNSLWKQSGEHESNHQPGVSLLRREEENFPPFALVDQPSKATWKTIQFRSQPLAQINSAKGDCGFCTRGSKFTILNWRCFAPTSQHPTQLWQAGHSGHDLNPGFSKKKPNFSKPRVCLISFKLGWIIQICLNLKYSSCELSLPAAADSYPPSPAEPSYSWIFHN